MAIHCRVALNEINEALTGERTREAMWSLPLAAPAEQIFDTLTAELPQSSQDLLKAEFETFPQSFLPMVLAMWREADEAQVPFALHSRLPSRALETARADRITFDIEADSEGFRITVEHNPNHHPSWIKPRSVLAAV